MSAADALDWAWVTLGIGTFLIAGGAFQIWFGKALIKGLQWVPRKKEPKWFWSIVGTWLVCGLVLAVLALPRIL